MLFWSKNSSEENYAFLEQKFIDGYIPLIQKNKEHNERLSDLIYDTCTDSYVDSKGNRFVFNECRQARTCKQRQGRPRKGMELSKQDYKQIRYVCKNYDGNGKKKYVSINASWEKTQQEQKQKLETEVGKQIFSKRKHDVETVFARIKHLFGFERFSLRGREGVNIEWNLVTIAHNMKKIMKYQTT